MVDLRATRAEINLDALYSNLMFFKTKLSNQKLCFTIKANAYGHGLLGTAQFAQEYVDYFAVATVYEGITLRQGGISIPILVLSPYLKEEIPYICEYDLQPIINDTGFLADFQQYGQKMKKKIFLHLKVDTGMHRAGASLDEVLNIFNELSYFDNIVLEGICTHFAMSDELNEKAKFLTEKQIDLFKDILEKIQEKYQLPPLVHAANTGGILLYENSHFTMVRLGIGAYGYLLSEFPELKPVMELKSKILLAKKIKKGESVSYGASWSAETDTQIGIIPIGYADGLSRLFSNLGRVLIEGKFYPIIGRICMDQMMIEIKGLEDPIGKDVLIFGNDPFLNADALAKQINTISYEVLTSVSNRVPRVYVLEKQ